MKNMTIAANAVGKFFDKLSKYFKPESKQVKTFSISSGYSSAGATLSGYIDILRNAGYKKSEGGKIWFPTTYNKIKDKLGKIEAKKYKIIFAIPGCDKIVSKYALWKDVESKYGRNHNITPETFLLDNESHIDMMKNEPKGTQFILKSKLQGKQGLLITDDLTGIEKKYEEGYKIAQKMVKPYLINGRKVNLRIYLMVVIKRGKIQAYMSKYGSCIYTNEKWVDGSDSFDTNVTSHNMKLSVYDGSPQTFNQLKTYLENDGKSFEKLIEQIKTNFIQFLGTKNNLVDPKFKNNVCAQVFGADFIIDENLNPLLLECNKGPNMTPSSTIIENPEELTDDMISTINNLKQSLDEEVTIENVLQVKKAYTKLYKGYPKYLTHKEILDRIEVFYKNEPSKSLPRGYVPGNGLKAQKDALAILSLLNSDNNGFERII